MAHRSFPSIYTWTIYNEGGGQLPGAEIELTSALRTLDPTRLIDSNSGWVDSGAGDYSDNHHVSSGLTALLNVNRSTWNLSAALRGIHTIYQILPTIQLELDFKASLEGSAPMFLSNTYGLTRERSRVPTIMS